MDENHLYQEQQAKLTTLQSLLQPGEQLLWHGAPARGIRLRSVDWFFFPVLVVWLGFGIAMMIQAARLFLLLTVIPIFFILPALYLILNQYIGSAIKRMNSYYCITDQRVIIMEPNGVTVLPLYQLQVLELEHIHHGIGIIYFSGKIPHKWMGADYRLNDQRLAFWFIPDAANVHAILASNIPQ